jgi:hypothetical protein
MPGLQLPADSTPALFPPGSTGMTQWRGTRRLPGECPSGGNRRARHSLCCRPQPSSYRQPPAGSIQVNRCSSCFLLPVATHAWTGRLLPLDAGPAPIWLGLGHHWFGARRRLVLCEIAPAGACDEPPQSSARAAGLFRSSLPAAVAQRIRHRRNQNPKRGTSDESDTRDPAPASATTSQAVGLIL